MKVIGLRKLISYLLPKAPLKTPTTVKVASWAAATMGCHPRSASQEPGKGLGALVGHRVHLHGDLRGWVLDSRRAPVSFQLGLSGSRPRANLRGAARRPSHAYQGEGHLQHGSEGQGAVEEGNTVHEEGVVGARAAQGQVLLARLLLLGHQESIDGAVGVLGAMQHHFTVGLGG